MASAGAASAVAVAAHLLHVAMVVVGVVVIYALLVGPRVQGRRRLRELRRTSAQGRLVEAALMRAQASLPSRDTSAFGSHVQFMLPGRSLPTASLRSPKAAAWPGGRAPGAAVAAALFSFAASAVHVYICPEHFREGIRFGLFFFIISCCQVGWGIALLRRADLTVVYGGLFLDVAVIALWSTTRLVSLPFGLDGREGVGLLDLLATGCEVVVASSTGLLLHRLRSGRSLGHRRPVRSPFVDTATRTPVAG